MMGGEVEQLRAAYISALSVCQDLPRVSSIAFVAMGTRIYKWPIELASKIAATELLKSKFDQTIVCL